MSDAVAREKKHIAKLEERLALAKARLAYAEKQATPAKPPRPPRPGDLSVAVPSGKPN